MTRDEAIKLLRGGPDGIAEWNKWRAAGEGIPSLYSANLYDANLEVADLRDADLRSADLYGANLYNADLCNADLRNANLRNANLRGANLDGANLCRARFSGMTLTPTQRDQYVKSQGITVSDDKEWK